MKAVQKVDFKIDQGEIVGFLGPNGVGKTTTLKMLSGLLHPTDGKASVLGFIPWELKPDYLRSMTLVMGQRNRLSAPLSFMNASRNDWIVPTGRFDEGCAISITPNCFPPPTRPMT